MMAQAKHGNPWDQALSELKGVLDEHSFKNWFEQTRFQSLDDGKVVVEVPNSFLANWLSEHYLESVSSILDRIVPDFKNVVFKTVPELAGRHIPPARPEGQRARVTKVTKSFPGFNARYTFDRFVIGSGNRFAHAAAKAVAESPGRAYNPLFLYGDTGLGKTHLMQAIGQEVLTRKPDSHCMFISSEDFTNQLIQSIADKSTHRFRNRFRKADILLIDDIQFIKNKDATQEEIFHTFNVLFDMHKQIVISSDRPPKDIQGIEERLVSRFEWGLVTDIQPPDLETRIAILKSKADREGLEVPADVLKCIATHVTSNIRELEGALITILAYSRLDEKKLTIGVVEDILGDLIGAEKIRPVTIDQIQRAVAEHFDVRNADLRGRSRQRQIVQPRQLAMYLCKELIPSLSLNDIGEAFGGRDHTTVMYACEQVGKRVKNEPHFRQTLDHLIRAVRN